MFSKNGGKKNQGGRAETEAAQEPVQDPRFPLFFSKPAVVSATRHAQAGVIVNQAPDFAKLTNSIPLNVTEFIEAAKFYPIVFTGGDSIMPLAITGLEKQNYFVNEKGYWQDSTYIPAYVRKYPFIFMDAGDNKLALCIDEAMPQFVMNAERDDAALRFLFENGQPTEFTNNALKFCGAFQEEYGLTRSFCDKLKELDLFTPNRTDASLPNGRKISLGGFQMIDRDKFLKLPDDKIMELHKLGLLPVIHYEFLATGNWRRLLDMAAAREPKKKAA